MAKLKWDQDSERLYETGVKHGVLYVVDSTGRYGKGVAWNGLTSISESPSGADETPLYADDIKYLSLRSKEEFGATIEAFTYPEEFEQCDGSASLTSGVVIGQQARKVFGMCYTTTVGNDTEHEDYGYKIHIIYGATCSPSQKAYNTINDSPEAITFSWELTTVPVEATLNGKTAYTSTVVVDSTKLEPEQKTNLAKLEEYLFGSESEDAQLPTPNQVANLISKGTIE